MVGFDFISLTSWKFREEGKIAHQVLLDPNAEGFPICIIEDMSLNKINFKVRSIIVSPLFVKSTNGGPVTVFAQF
jgi:kynurenine formamidase